MGWNEVLGWIRNDAISALEQKNITCIVFISRKVSAVIDVVSKEYAETTTRTGGLLKMNETLKVLKERRSCRSFKPYMVKEDDLKAIIEAGTYAAEPAKAAAPGKENYVYCI